MKETPIDCALGANTRLQHFHRAAKYIEPKTEDSLATYTNACKDDLNSLSAVLSRVYNCPGFPGVNFRLGSELHVGAFVAELKPDEYLIEITVGTLLAVDDFATWISPYYRICENSLSENSPAHELRKNDSNWRLRGVDYNFLNESRSNIPLEIDISRIQKDIELRAMIANAMILWILFHEIGHIALSHFQRKSTEKKIDEFHNKELDAFASANWNQRLWQEFEADVFATYQLFTSFATEASLDSAKSVNSEASTSWLINLVRNVSSYSLFIFLKADNAFSGVDSLKTHPSNTARSFNNLVASDSLMQSVATLSATANSLPAEIGSDFQFLSLDLPADIACWDVSISHLIYVARLMDAPLIDLGIYTYDISNKNDFRVRVNNELQRSLYMKIYLSVWHARYRLHFFIEGEGFYEACEEFYRLLEFAPNFEDLKGDQFPNTFYLLGRRFVYELYQTIRSDEFDDIGDLEKIRKCLWDTFLISSLVEKLRL